MEPQLSVVTYVLLLLPLAVLLAWAWTGVWAWRDAQRRGKPPALVVLLVLLAAWPLGLLVWLLIRPDDDGPGPGAGGRRRFDLDDYRVQ